MIFKNNKFNTEPCILHFPGKNKKRLTNSLLNEIIKSSKIEKPSNLTIITFATKDILSDSPLIQQLYSHNVEFININDFYEITQWNNLLKISLLTDYLNKNNVTTEYIIVLDSLDIVLAQNFIDIVDKFSLVGKKILYAATVNKFPNILFDGECEENVDSEFKYLNAGAVIAETSYYKDFLNQCNNNIDMEVNIWKSEQYEIRKNYASYDKNIIGYDYNCNILKNVFKNKIIKQNGKN